MLEEGDWQARIVGAVSEEELSLLRSFGNVERVVVHEEEAKRLMQQMRVPDEAELGISVTDIYFHHPRTIYQDMTLISERIGLDSERIMFNYRLLSMYLIRIPGDDKPRMILPLFAAIMVVVCFSLIIVIHNAFAVSMNARIHQLGILSSIGATPRQICTSLIREAVLLCTLPVLGGGLLGIGASCGLLMMMNVLAAQLTGRHDLVYRYHPIIFVLTVFISMLTVLVSAWIPAGKLAKMTPLEAIRGTEEMQLRKKKHSPVLFRLFGIEGELAGNALRAQRKALRTSTISLTFAFLGFTVMLCFFKLSDISTRYTYFARYQDTWDVMATVKDVRIEDVDSIEGLQKAVRREGAISCVGYQKAAASAYVPASQISDEISGLGGLERLAGEKCIVAEALASAEDGRENDADDGQSEHGRNYIVQASLVIMDDAGFIEYCEQIGMAPRLNGAVVINHIWDSVNSNFRYPVYVPYLREDGSSTILLQGDAAEPASGENDETVTAAGNEPIEIPVIGYTDREPNLREEYEDYALVHVMPVSLWKDISGRKGHGINVEPDAYIRILADRREEESMTNQNNEWLSRLNRIEEAAVQTLGEKYDVETENRVQEKEANDRMIWGYQFIVGIFCSLLAVIGIANVFAYTMGFMRVRRRECARYLSVGMTPEELKKMFRIEMLVIAGRPVIVTVPLTVVMISFMIKASYLNPAEFWSEAPYVPAVVFIAAVFGFVAVAYAIGGRKILNDSLVEALRNDAVT